ncbi:hypothetical protein [Demequina sp. NBRC 110051]|uniref:hypothetical protein n=1 Tax=Demequina sp. NBRC 110051 TaxID=1570340 RepID=UPI0009FCED0C|nr:hypothetical protein [Demequina sp. NBRC 110051]
MRREAWGFAAGSVLFIVAAYPHTLAAIGVIATNALYLAGSLLFLWAAIEQLRLDGRRVPRQGSTPGNIADWWAAAMRLLGAGAFVASILSSLVAALTAVDAADIVWTSAPWGSAAYVSAAILALVAVSKREQLWDPRARTPATAWLTLAGSLAFAAAAVVDYGLPPGEQRPYAEWIAAATIAGGVFFIVATLASQASRAAQHRD